jgi:hypothetical protein
MVETANFTHSEQHHEDEKGNEGNDSRQSSVSSEMSIRSALSLRKSKSLLFPSLCFLLSLIVTNSNGQLSVRQEPLSTSRSLKIGDFQALNELYSDTQISLPDAVVKQKVAGFTLTLDLTDITCQNITIGDIRIDWAVRNSKEIPVNISLLDLDILCQLNYEYSYILNINGRGVVNVATRYVLPRFCNVLCLSH